MSSAAKRVTVMPAKRHGVWRCLCGCELYAAPSKSKDRNHDTITPYGFLDKPGRWVYEERNDRFLHDHGRKIGLLLADFVEDRDGGGIQA